MGVVTLLQSRPEGGNLVSRKLGLGSSQWEDPDL